MASFEQGDVIKVPFPYTDRPIRQSRPAMVVSTDAIKEAHGLLWVVMITRPAGAIVDPTQCGQLIRESQ
jgi:mRNA interferase MazF